MVTGSVSVWAGMPSPPVSLPTVYSCSTKAWKTSRLCRVRHRSPTVGLSAGVAGNGCRAQVESGVALSTVSSE
jgi:hypothetical protein